ncbi:MAG: hypothetical protein AB7F31_00245 [Parachlamydiales bacterium]
MRCYTIALFGQTERGQYRVAHYCNDLAQLVETFGHPPPETTGLYLAIQALLYNRAIIFFRVEEEGFSVDDYLLGLNYLKGQDKKQRIAAIGLPGVGDREIIEASTPICTEHKSLLVFTEADLYDYLTAEK